MEHIKISYTNDYAEACDLRDLGYEPIECAFGQLGSVLGPLAMDHHGTESHREGVALRACRDHYGARRDDPRFVVTGAPDADAILSITALAGLVPESLLTPPFYELVNHQDIDPIGLDLFESPEGERLAWFNQRQGLTQSEAGFRRALTMMIHVLTEGVTYEEADALRRSDRARRRRALVGIQLRLDAWGTELPIPDDLTGRVLCRGPEAIEGAARVVVVNSTVWGFDQWYRLAPVVVSFASRLAKITVGCPDVDTAERLFGPGGLENVWRAMGKGWGGRPTIGGSPRGVKLTLAGATSTAHKILPLLI